MRAFGTNGLVAAATAMLLAPAHLQRPDLSGIWIAAEPAAAQSVASRGDARFATGGAGTGWASPLTITQTPTELGVGYEVFSAYDLQPPLHFVYALDGSPSTNTMMIGHATATLRSQTAWRGDTLVITTSFPSPPEARGGPARVAVRQSLHLEGRTTLVIETVRAGILGATATTTRTVFRKS